MVFPELIDQKINWYRWRWNNNRLLTEYRKRVKLGVDCNLYWDSPTGYLRKIYYRYSITLIYNFVKGRYQSLLPKNYFEFIDWMNGFPELVRQKISWYRWKWDNNKLLIEFGMRVKYNDTRRILWWKPKKSFSSIVVGRIISSRRKQRSILNFVKGGYQAPVPTNYYFEFIDWLNGFSRVG